MIPLVFHLYMMSSALWGLDAVLKVISIQFTADLRSTKTRSLLVMVASRVSSVQNSESIWKPFCVSFSPCLPSLSATTFSLCASVTISSILDATHSSTLYFQLAQSFYVAYKKIFKTAEYGGQGRPHKSQAAQYETEGAEYGSQGRPHESQYQSAGSLTFTSPTCLWVYFLLLHVTWRTTCITLHGNSPQGFLEDTVEATNNLCTRAWSPKSWSRL